MDANIENGWDELVEMSRYCMIVYYHLVTIEWASINDLCMALKKKGGLKKDSYSKKGTLS